MTLATVALVPAACTSHDPDDAAQSGRPDAVAAAEFDVTSAVEAERVDSVPTPTPDWIDCGDVFTPGAECAQVELPLDYDEPDGPTTTVAVLRVPATSEDTKIGTLFVNPGGPGESGVELAANAADGLSPELRAAFDIVGFDPRGTGYSDHVQCFADDDPTRADVVAAMEPDNIFGEAEQEAAVQASIALGTACSTTGRDLAGSMSTAEVARDMDVLRRMVGDEQLTYLGLSYGSYLGTVYANLFPDRVRAVIIDGVDDPLAWSGTKDDDAGLSMPLEALQNTGEADARILDEVFARCEEAGPAYCTLASIGDPAQVYADVAAALEAQPLVLTDPATGETTTITRGLLLPALLNLLYGPDGPSTIDMVLSGLAVLVGPPAPEGSDDAAAQAMARDGVLAFVAQMEADEAAPAALKAERRAALGLEPAADNGLEAMTAVTCTDGLHPSDATAWPEFAAATDATTDGLGRYWTWLDAPCATATWTAQDEDTYTGPFTHRSAAPVLVIGSYWDPATRYEGAVSAAELLPNSRLLSSDNWGHTAIGSSDCVNDAIEAYLLTGEVPAEGTVCTADYQPFTTPLESPES
jgi:pimeloyl-ACP methyl ester carboxylesterase